MEARFLRVVGVILAASLSLGANARSTNFIVSASDAQFAQTVAEEAERFRRELAIEWLGREIPQWNSPCPITVQDGDHLGAGGATSFSFDQGEVYGWKMDIQGSRERVLDSVLPHEVNHTIFATYFRRPLPRWADEGACTTVEHFSERQKQQSLLIKFLKTERGIPFSSMFVMKEYPRDVLPLYSQGYSLTRFFIAQGGKRKFVQFIGDGMAREDWVGAVSQHYSYANLRELQDTWVEWVRRGSSVEEFNPNAIAQANAPAPQQSFDNDAGAPPVPNPFDVAFAADARSAAQAAAAPVSPGVTQVGLNSMTAGQDYATPAGGYAAAPNAGRTTKQLDDSGWVAVGSRYPRQGAASPTTIASLPNAPNAAPTPYAPGQPVSGTSSASRPQPVMQAQQVILEWRRPDGAGPLPGETPPAEAQFAGPTGAVPPVMAPPAATPPGAAPVAGQQPPLAFDAPTDSPFVRY